MKKILLILSLILSTSALRAQCTQEITAFQNGEFLTYDLYYNWSFIWVKAGSASMSTVKSVFRGHPSYRTSLVTRGNNRLDDFFVLRDTLLCYVTEECQPLYFRKGAREGDRYTVDEVFYEFKNGKCLIHQHYINRHGTHRNKDKESTYCIFDMMSMLMRARNFNPKGWKKGYQIAFPMADGDDIYDCKLIYRGTDTYKMDNTGKKFRCLVLSFMQKEDGKDREIVRFYVTDDDNHIPVRLDMFLRFGSAKAFLNGYKGLRNPLDALKK